MASAKDKVTGKVAGEFGEVVGKGLAKAGKGILDAAGVGAKKAPKATPKPAPKAPAKPAPKPAAPKAPTPAKPATPKAATPKAAAPKTPPAAKRTPVPATPTRVPPASKVTKAATPTKAKPAPKAAPVKKATPAKPAAPVKKAAPAKPAAPVKKAAPAKKAPAGGGKPPKTPKEKPAATPEPTPAGPVTETKQPRKFITKRTAFELGGFAAPAVVGQAEQNNLVPDWLKTPLEVAANAAAVAAGGSALGRGIFGKGLARKAGREALKTTKGILPKTKTVYQRGILPVIGAGTIYGNRNIFDGLGGNQADAAPTIPVEEYQPTPGFIPETQAPVLPEGTLPEVPGTPPKGLPVDPEGDAEDQKNLLDDAYDQALQALIDAFGGIDAANAANAAGDPILAQQLAAIDADYQAGLGQIAANYNGALAQIQGYMNQQTQIMGGLTDAQAASFEAAAGGLEGMSPGVGLGADQAAAAGISDTALGGAGVTGAALARSLSGANQAALAAEQMRGQTTLSDQLATGKLSQADLEAALAREALGAKGEARKASAVRESEARIKSQENKIRVAEIKYQTILDKAKEKQRQIDNEKDRLDAYEKMRYASELTLAEEKAKKAAETTVTPGFRFPPFTGTMDSRPGTTEIKGLVDANGAPVTVDKVNIVTDTLDALIAAVAGMPKTDAQGQIADFYARSYKEDPAFLKILKYAGRPTSVGALLKILYGTPTK